MNARSRFPSMESAFRNTSEVLIPGPGVIRLGTLSGFIILNRSATGRWETVDFKTDTSTVFWAKRPVISSGNAILVLDHLQITEPFAGGSPKSVKQQHLSIYTKKLLLENGSWVPKPPPVPVPPGHLGPIGVAHHHDVPESRLQLWREVLGNEWKIFSISVSDQWESCDLLGVIRLGLCICWCEQEHGSCFFSVSCIRTGWK